MKKEINAFEYAGQICHAMKKGILMTTKNGEFVNTMVIGWGHIGIEWGRPIFVAYVRESRHTKTLVDKNPEFTINIPYGEYDKSILGFCGTKSGREVDKSAALGLTLEDGETVSVPAIRELPLTLECKVIYKQEQIKEAIAPDALERYYPVGDFHTAYYGQITNAYIVE